jgi:hypothetical protein
MIILQEVYMDTNEVAIKMINSWPQWKRELAKELLGREGKQMPRSEVLRYAEAMEQKLQANDEEKGSMGWKDCETEFLLNKLDEEVEELKDIVQGFETFREAIKIARRCDEGIASENVKAMVEIKKGLRKLLGKEAADVGNICMMISDVCGALPEVSK